MGIFNHEEYVRENLREILTELKKLTKNEACMADNVVSTTSNNLTFNRKGCLFWWNKISDAASYRLRLSIEDDEIDVIEFDRNKSWYLFNGYVAGLTYTVKLIAENRNGQSIANCELSF